MTDARDLYLDLMKRALTCLLWNEAEANRPVDSSISRRFYERWALNLIARYLSRTGRQITQPVSFDPETRLGGRDWPPPAFAHTMIGTRRLDNLQMCIEEVIKNDVPGDLIETGVWRGGATIFMRAVLEAYGISNRCVWVADSFEGLPAPDPAKYPADKGGITHKLDVPHVSLDILSVSLEEVQANFARYGLLDEQVCFLKGWFKDTLPHAPIRKLAVLRLDGDMYESTMDSLTHLFPKLSAGGYIIIDDYFLKGCREAVHDFRDKYGIDDPIKDIDGMGAYWQSTEIVTIDA